MMSLFILSSFAMALASADTGQRYEFPVDPGLIYPARNSVPYSLAGAGQNQLIGYQDSLPINHLFNWPLFNQDISSSSLGHLAGAPEKFILDPLHPSNEPVNVKQFYIFAAPEQPEIPDTRPIPPPPVHTKIIFIKAPSPPKARVQVIQPPEEKTIIYVLVKKPDDTEIEISPPVTKKPSKPEVFFIHYKSRKNASRNGPAEENSSGESSLDGEKEGTFRDSGGPNEDYKK